MERRSDCADENIARELTEDWIISICVTTTSIRATKCITNL